MKLTVTQENATLINEWLKNRGGVAVWESVNLSNPGAEVLTPADRIDKPSWQVGNKPVRIVTDVADVLVTILKELKRFHVATRMGSQGLSVKVSDGGSRRIRREVSKAGEGATYTFDYGAFDNCVILVPEKTMTLAEFCAAQ
jgi:hypothetical protein